MMNWGALITADDGTQFITDESTPISLQGIYTASGSNTVTQVIPYDTSDVVLPFCVSTGNNFFAYGISGNTIQVTAQAADTDNSPFTFSVYLFTTRAQPVPSWGVAIWDRNGKCILTNETKVLTDIQNQGTKGTNDSGLGMSRTLPGKWAILPEVAGYIVGVIQQRPFQIGIGFASRYDGANTYIVPVQSSSIPAGGQPTGSLDAKTVVRAINVSRYE